MDSGWFVVLGGACDNCTIFHGFNVTDITGSRLLFAVKHDGSKSLPSIRKDSETPPGAPFLIRFVATIM